MNPDFVRGLKEGAKIMTAVVAMLVALFVLFLLYSGCSMPIEPATDVDEVSEIEQEAQVSAPALIYAGLAAPTGWFAQREIWQLFANDGFQPVYFLQSANVMYLATTTLYPACNPRNATSLLCSGRVVQCPSITADALPAQVKWTFGMSNWVSWVPNASPFFKRGTIEGTYNPSAVSANNTGRGFQVVCTYPKLVGTGYKLRYI
jgi:hypothetical protein